MMQLMKRRNFLYTAVGAVAVGGLAKLLGPLRPFAAGKIAAPGQKPLKAAIVYYSATGSTLKVAKAIHRGMKQVIDCDYFPIKKADPKKMANYDLVILGGPIWYSRETANLKLFVHLMPQMPGKLCVLFCTHGVGPNGFMKSLSQTVLKRELTIIGWNDWYGSVFHVLHQPKPYHTDGHPDATDLQEAEAFGRTMAEKAQKIVAGDTSLIPEIPTNGTLWVGMEGGMGGAGGRGPGGNGPGAAGGGAPSAPVRGVGAPAAAMPGKVMMASTAAAGAASRGSAPGVASAPGGAGGPGAPGGGPGGPGGMGGGLNKSTKLPVFDMTKCVYPRCNACEDVFPVEAINFDITAPGRLSSGDGLLVKSGCISCSLCERVCVYDGVVQGDNGPRPKTSHAIDMKKCTYPKCTLCLQNCPQNSIDFSHNPPLFHHDCEGCDMCWCVCPTGAVSIPNLAITQAAMANRGGRPGEAPGKSGSTPGAMAGGPVGETADDPAEAAAERLQGVSPISGPFRRLVPLDQIGYNHLIFENQNTPRIIVDPENGNTTYCSSPCKV
jgi:flavodoxin/formate hydrogenlyase subunit 6/NADH:ubiquinone oxidoreductase subunit I